MTMPDHRSESSAVVCVECADCDGTGRHDYFNGDYWYPGTCETCDGLGRVSRNEMENTQNATSA